MEFSIQTIDDGPVCSGELSKADEVRLLDGIIRECPDGYIRDILRDLRPQIVDAVRNDFGCIFADLRRDLADLQAERETLKTETKRLSESFETMKKQFRQAQDLKREAETLARTLKDTVSRIRDL